MSKYILKTVKTCDKCEFSFQQGNTCRCKKCLVEYVKDGAKLYGTVWEPYEIPDWCPLPETPHTYLLLKPQYQIQPKTERELSAFEYGRCSGWNDCLQEILNGDISKLEEKIIERLYPATIFKERED